MRSLAADGCASACALRSFQPSFLLECSGEVSDKVIRLIAEMRQIPSHDLCRLADELL